MNRFMPCQADAGNALVKLGVQAWSNDSNCFTSNTRKYETGINLIGISGKFEEFNNHTVMLITL